jgi:hypothetical protein
MIWKLRSYYLYQTRIVDHWLSASLSQPADKEYTTSCLLRIVWFVYVHLFAMSLSFVRRVFVL